MRDTIKRFTAVLLAASLALPTGLRGATGSQDAFKLANDIASLKILATASGDGCVAAGPYIEAIRRAIEMVENAAIADPQKTDTLNHLRAFLATLLAGGGAGAGGACGVGGAVAIPVPTP